MQVVGRCTCGRYARAQHLRTSSQRLCARRMHPRSGRQQHGQAARIMIIPEAWAGQQCSDLDRGLRACVDPAKEQRQRSPQENPASTPAVALGSTGKTAMKGAVVIPRLRGSLSGCRLRVEIPRKLYIPTLTRFMILVIKNFSTGRNRRPGHGAATWPRRTGQSTNPVQTARTDAHPQAHTKVRTARTHTVQAPARTSILILNPVSFATTPPASTIVITTVRANTRTFSPNQLSIQSLRAAIAASIVVAIFNLF